MINLSRKKNKFRTVMRRNRRTAESSPTPSQHQGGLALSRHGSKNSFMGGVKYGRETGADNYVSSHITKLAKLGR